MCRSGEGGKVDGARVLTANGIGRRKVKGALTSRTEAAIASGLAAGETLIVSDGRPRAGKAGGGKSNNPSAGARPPGPPGGPM